MSKKHLERQLPGHRDAVSPRIQEGLYRPPEDALFVLDTVLVEEAIESLRQ